MQKTKGMKLVKGCVAAMLFAAVLSVTGTDARAKEPYQKIANSYEWSVVKLVNKQRVANGLEPVGVFRDLQKVSGIRAKEIAKYFSHSRPDGRSCFSVLDDYNISLQSAGENIAAGYGNPKAVMNGWMNSEGHRNNILNNSYDHIGVGYAKGGSYGKNWVQLFVGGCDVKKIKVNGSGVKKYAKGTSISKMNRYLIVTCNDHGKSYVPIVEGMCKGYNSKRTGYQTITVKYRNKKVKMKVYIRKSSRK